MMGEAKLRGDRESRVRQAIQREAAKRRDGGYQRRSKSRIGLLIAAAMAASSTGVK
jgi:hypothetical protein